MISEILRGRERKNSGRRKLVRGAARFFAGISMAAAIVAAILPQETQAQEQDPNPDMAAFIDNSRTWRNYIVVEPPLGNPLSLGNKQWINLEVNYQAPETPSDAQVTLLTILKRTPEDERAYNFAMGIDLSGEDDSASVWAQGYARPGERNRADEVISLLAESEEGIIAPGEWNEFGVELEGVENRCSIRLFVNGEDVGSNSIARRNCQIVSDGAGAITVGFPVEGLDEYGAGRYLTGRVDELTVQGRSDEQTNTPMPGFFVPWSTNNSVRLRMNGNLEDASGNGNIGSAIGEVSFTPR